ncbi:alpha/beta fold hydrolase [Pseudonocardia spinosispora]|uniref:alpha/beta fold hydrolase n=1 Tax=Pseudonocardia spinosispora TaxID=103441 RepID=UPI0003FF1EB4|nr:alpha/beta hydrolase [Pseudonocardia spinosispora]
MTLDDWPLPEVFDFEGQQVRWGRIGEGDPLVLLHGTPFSSVVWRRIAPYLAAHRTVYYFDLLGYGRSEMRDGQDVSLGVQNRLFAALLDHWGLDRPDVVAHDFGGATALRTMLLNDRRYRTLTLVDPVAIGPSGSPFVQAALRHEQAYGELPGYIHEAAVRAYVQGAAHRPLAEDDLMLYVRPWLGEQGQAAFYRQIAQMSDRYTDEIEDRFGEVDCPVTVVWGEQDTWIPHQRGRTLADRIPNADFHLIPHARHLVQDDAPEAILASVLARL